MTAARDYAAAAEVLEGLGQAVRERADALGCSLAAIAAEACVPEFVMFQVERGYGTIHVDEAVNVLRWLARTSEDEE